MTCPRSHSRYTGAQTLGSQAASLPCLWKGLLQGNVSSEVPLGSPATAPTSPAHPPKSAAYTAVTPSPAPSASPGLSPGAACNTPVSTELPDRAPPASAPVKLCGLGLGGLSWGCGRGEGAPLAIHFQQLRRHGPPLPLPQPQVDEALSSLCSPSQPLDNRQSFFKVLSRYHMLPQISPLLEWGSVIVPKAALPFSSLSPVGRTLGSPLPLSASLRAVAAPLEAPCTAGGSSGGAGPSSFSGAEGSVLRITLPESWGHRAPGSAPHCRAQGCTLWLRQVCRGPGVKSRLLPAG